MAVLLPWPGKPGFWDQVRPHVLRLVRFEGESSADADPLPARPLRLRPLVYLVYIVRPGHEEEDRQALDAACARPGCTGSAQVHRTVALSLPARVVFP